MKNPSIKITSLSNADYDFWLALWQNYLTFYETSLPMSTTDATWHNLLDSNIAIYGFGAWQGDTLVGITHVVLHPSTWTSTGCCYLQDLYVSESIRGQGIGRALIEYVYDFATQKGCNHVYWKTQESNTDARQLYDKVASLTDMVQYRKNL
ncbi:MULTISPECIES: GNAT family N-acetyltransferase [unclassified Psychrobacter]|uniref:GNAT family N-acetyltransferase n=1 Tax=unclassified Psychrobacter TaxID=196806 RepID=UPI0025B55D24|nr:MULTISPECIES: GNAT family N-acetyltransferase [unclassified Psychrobacter]MDN3454636.1 GNAT family N-acetyltransferase [Psychrobacter sp. APC 3350]MDN3503901.1 GNAT family N-acetyltransferase [Psychrobacter sp. 5A.1]